MERKEETQERLDPLMVVLLVVTLGGVEPTVCCVKGSRTSHYTKGRYEKYQIIYTGWHPTTVLLNQSRLW